MTIFFLTLDNAQMTADVLAEPASYLTISGHPLANLAESFRISPHYGSMNAVINPFYSKS